MIKPILSAAALSVMVVSVAWASQPSADLQLITVKIGKNDGRNGDGIRHGREGFDENRQDHRFESIHNSYRVFVPRRRAGAE
jgi:hypothetical protein